MPDSAIRRHEFLSAARHPIIWLVTVVVLGATAMVYMYSRAEVLDAGQRRFEQVTASLAERIRARMYDYETAMLGGVALFAASTEVTRRDWRAYVDALQLMQRFPGIQGMGYTPVVLNLEKSAHESAVRAEGFTDYAIKPDGERRLYTPVFYIEPFNERNVRAFGFDMMSEPVRRAAMERARDTGHAALSGKVTLVQETGQDVQAGTLMYLPVYRRSEPADSVEERRATLQGYIYAPFRLNDLIRATVRDESNGVGIEIYDGTAPAKDALLYDDRPSRGYFESDSPDAARFTRTLVIELAGQPWTLFFTSDPGFESDVIDANTPRLIATGGLLISAMLMWTVWTLNRTRARAEEIAQATTGELRATHALQSAIVESADYAIMSMDADGVVRIFNPAAERMLGYRKEEVAGKATPELWLDRSELAARATSLSAKLGQPVEPGFATIVARARHGITEQSEWTFVRKDGTTVPVLVAVSALNDENGRIKGYVGIASDISERRRAEQLTRDFTAQLEKRVAQRTVALEQANATLALEISGHERTQQALQEAYRKLQDSLREMALLREMGEMLQSCEGSGELNALVTRFGTRLFPGLSGGLYLLQPSQDLLEAESVWGTIPKSDQVFEPGDCWALRRGKLHQALPDAPAMRCRHVADEIPYVCVPLTAQGDILGVLHLRGAATAGADGSLPSATSTEQAAGMAELIALAMSNLRLRESLREQSIRDPLTGLFNRRYLDETLAREERRASRAGQSIGVLLFDVDHFKRFNDTYGHDAGDTVLREVGRLLRERVRGGDIAARYGGEEFLVALPGAGLEISMERAEELRRAVEGLELHHMGRALGQVTISIGVAQIPLHGETWREAQHQADKALYRAKHAGRNRVMLAEEIVERSTDQSA